MEFPRATRRPLSHTDGVKSQGPHRAHTARISQCASGSFASLTCPSGGKRGSAREDSTRDSREVTKAGAAAISPSISWLIPFSRIARRTADVCAE